MKTGFRMFLGFYHDQPAELSDREKVRRAANKLENIYQQIDDVLRDQEKEPDRLLDQVYEQLHIANGGIKPYEQQEMEQAIQEAEAQSEAQTAERPTPESEAPVNNGKRHRVA